MVATTPRHGPSADPGMPERIPGDSVSRRTKMQAGAARFSRATYALGPWGDLGVGARWIWNDQSPNTPYIREKDTAWYWVELK